MSVREIESAIQRLSPQELREFLAWFEDYCEDNLELTDDVKAKLQQAREDVGAGRYRTRKP
jgi:ABC-type Zn uptake system ZnuABC Zn-binding protein ZnuA